jgi:hypothetical protein
MLRQRTDKIKIYIDLIYGLPEDSPETYEAGIRYAMSLLPQKIQPHPLLLLPGSPLFDNPESFGLVYEEKAPHYVVESNSWSRADMELSAKWTDKLFFYFNPAVNTTIIMLSQILKADPFDLFQQLYAFISQRFEPNSVITDIGIQREQALALNDLLEEFIREALCAQDQFAYLEPLIDVMAFAGCKTTFYSSVGNSEQSPYLGLATAGPWNLTRSGIYPLLSRHVVLKRFSHDMSALYSNNLLKSPDELLKLRPKVYDVVFNLLTHSIYHVSEHMSDLLASSSGNFTLDEMVQQVARARNLAVDNSSYLDIQNSFDDLAHKQVVDLYGSQIAY